MNPKKMIPNIFGMPYSDVKSAVDMLSDGQSAEIGGHVVTSLYRKTVSRRDIHYVKIEKDGMFVGKIGMP